MKVFDKKAIFTGTQINYYIVCPTKLWFFSHFATMEKNSDIVELGKLLQEKTYSEVKKDIVIDQKISIDFIRRGNKLILHEIKKSSALEKAHIAQMLYYLYYLKNMKGIDNVEGIINYPLKRRVVKLSLTPENEKELEDIFQKIKEIISQVKPPKPEKKIYCRKCSYFEFCWI